MHQTIQAARTCISAAFVSDRFAADERSRYMCTVCSLEAELHRVGCATGQVISRIYL
jgi:hypothetical protein